MPTGKQSSIIGRRFRWLANDLTARYRDEDDRSRSPLTVADAIRDYIEFLETSRRTAADARYRDKAFIAPVLGNIEVAKLTADRIRKWLNAVAKAPPRRRTKAGGKAAARRRRK